MNKNKPADPVPIDIKAVRSSLVDKGLVFFAVFGPLALLISLSRILEFGWNAIYFPHIGLMAFIVAAAIFLIVNILKTHTSPSFVQVSMT